MEKEKKRSFINVFLIVGIVLLIFTFAAAFVFLVLGSGIQGSSPGLSEALGGILGPIADALIKVLFLGVMGWIGSIFTVRGIQLMSQVKTDETGEKKQTTGE